MIKNPDTHLARQVKRINTEYRLALSGTPMENSKTDLWSIFDFVMPGFLGPQEAFKARYVNTPSPSEVQDLVRRIRPFLLRRTKKKVLPELPPKIEETIYVDLTQNQLSLYLHTMQQIRKNSPASGSGFSFLKGRPQIDNPSSTILTRMN